MIDGQRSSNREALLFYHFQPGKRAFGGGASAVSFCGVRRGDGGMRKKSILSLCSLGFDISVVIDAVAAGRIKAGKKP